MLTFMQLKVRAEPVAINEALVLALARSRANGRLAYQIAAAAGVHPSELSRFVNGHKLPTRTEAEHVAAELGYRVDQLFPRVRRARLSGSS
jgi:transcriptional regulator with XRE-family HTH domain